MAMLFAYRDVCRGTCEYVEDSIGTRKLHAPGSMTTVGQAAYCEIETVLTREQYDEFCQQGLTEDVLEALSSLQASAFAAGILDDEVKIACHELQLSEQDVRYALEHYTEPYRDMAVIACVFDDWTDAVKNVSLGLGIACSAEPDFNIDGFIDELREGGEFVELPSGKVVEYRV